MAFLITVVITNIVIVALAIYFVKRLLRGARKTSGNGSASAVKYEQPVPHTKEVSAQKVTEPVVDIPAEPTGNSEEIQPASQEAIRAMDIMDVYRLPEGPERTSCLMAFAEAGDGAAQYLLGEAYLFETGGVKRDFGKAKDLLQKSADQGNSNAMADMVLVCMELLLDLYDEAAAKGEAKSEYQPKAMELMDEAAYNLAKALTNYNKLALSIYSGNLKMDWNKGDIREQLLEKTGTAMQPLLEELKAEDQGHSNYILGMLTMRGIGTPQDINQAKMYFERGAELGNYESQFELQNPLFTMDDDDE